MNAFDPERLLIVLAVIIPAIGFHEYGHAKFADLAGDPTPRSMGRVTLNLFNHFDPLGFTMIVLTALTGYGIGWGRPVVVNPSLMKNPRWDHFVSVAAGPMINLLQAAIYGLIFRLMLFTGLFDPILEKWTFYGMAINLSLFFFNLIPLGILDGHWLVGLLMPAKPRQAWYKFNHTYGLYILIGLVLIGPMMGISIVGAAIGPAVSIGLRLLRGF